MTIQESLTGPPLAPADLLRLRRQVEDQIEYLIALLDDLDGDPLFQEDGDEDADTDDEPSLGWRHTMNQARLGGAGSDGLDLEEDHDGREPEEDQDTGDDEPWLGSPETFHQTGAGHYGDTSDREVEVIAPEKYDAARQRLHGAPGVRAQAWGGVFIPHTHFDAAIADARQFVRQAQRRGRAVRA